MAEWQPIETVPNNVFDVLARYWDAGLDKFLYRRFTDCVLVDDQVCANTSNGVGRLVDGGFKPERWMEIPSLPEELK